MSTAVILHPPIGARIAPPADRVVAKYLPPRSHDAGRRFFTFSPLRVSAGNPTAHRGVRDRLPRSHPAARRAESRPLRYERLLSQHNFVRGQSSPWSAAYFALDTKRATFTSARLAQTPPCRSDLRSSSTSPLTPRTASSSTSSRRACASGEGDPAERFDSSELLDASASGRSRAHRMIAHLALVVQVSSWPYREEMITARVRNARALAGSLDEAAQGDASRDRRASSHRRDRKQSMKPRITISRASLSFIEAIARPLYVRPRLSP